MRILLADDQPKLRYGLKLLLRREPAFDIVGEATDMESLQLQLKGLQPDVLLLDWELPGLTPADALSLLRTAYPRLKVIVLSGRLEARGTALAAGADAFVSKSKPPAHLLTALREVV